MVIAIGAINLVFIALGRLNFNAYNVTKATSYINRNAIHNAQLQHTLQ